MAAKIEPQSALASPDESASTPSPAVAGNSSPTIFQLDPSKTRIASAVTSAASVAVIILGIGVLIGWTADISLLKKIWPNLASMKPNTAVCFVLSGVSLWLLRSAGVTGTKLRLGQIGAPIVVLIGALTLIEFIFKLNLHIDQFLFPSATAAGGAHPGRMAFATALTFVLLGSALLFINEKTKGRSLTDLLAGSAAAITLLTFLAYLYKVEALYRLVPFTGIAIHTMIGSFILCAGVFFSRARDGFIAVFLSDTAGGTVARRLLPVAILVPPLLGWFRLMGERRGLYEPAFGIAVVASFLIVFLVTVIARTALVIDSAELVRRRAEDRTRLVVEAAPSALVMLDEQGRIALINSQTEKLFGYSRAELLGDPIERLLPERYLSSDSHDRDNFLTGLINGAKGAGKDLYGLRKDGREVPIEIGLNPIKTDRGNFVLADIVDLTRRRETEDTLRQSENRAKHGQRIWERTFDAIGEGILVHDHQMRIVRCNLQAAEMLNLTPAEVVGMKFTDAFATVFGQQAADYYLSDSREASSSFDARTNSGRRYIVSIFPIKNSDDDTVSVVMWNDVTMLSEIQEQLGRSRRLASVGQLAAGVAHEVNNPLAAITTCAEAVIRDMRNTEGAREMAEDHQWNYYLEEIVRQSLRCKEITRGLLDLTRQRKARRLLIDLNAIVKQCARVALQRVESDIEFDIVLDENIGNVATDQEMLRQILDNLLTNAIDSLNGQAGRISVSTTREGDRIAVEIADTGHGIPAELLSKIFDPFFSTKGPGKGYGLGLAICLSLAESLGGSITVETKEDSGSKFRLWIPRRAPEQAAEA